MALANRHPWKAELDMLNIEPGDGGGPSSDQGSGADLIATLERETA